MSEIAKEHPSTINRFIVSNNVRHLESGQQRNLKYPVEESRAVLKKFVFDTHPIRKKVWSFYNFKGGTGKTSLCFQISSLLALCGYKVLVIDVDPQGNLSTSLGFDIAENFFTLYDVIINNISPFEAIREVFPGYSCIPSNIACSRFDMELSMKGRREEQFKIRLSSLKDHYDLILFDTNPNISFIIRNLTIFSDLICVPCETQPYSVNALGVLFEDMTSFFEMMDLQIPEMVIVPNKYEDRYGTAAEAMTVLRKNFSQYLVPDFAVRKAEDFNIAAKEGLPLACIAKKNSIALQDVIELSYYMLDKSK
jgi:chromosome partitioning protein